MTVYNGRELIQKKIAGFIKYQVGPYLFWANRISERIWNKPVVDLNENEVLFRSGIRSAERLGEALPPVYSNPMLSLVLLVDGFGNYIAILGQNRLNNRKKSI